MSKRVIPADPEEQNDDRAKAAEAAVLSFAENYGEMGSNGRLSLELLQQNLSDLLCDFAHLCDRKGLSLEALIDTAKMHYQDETKPGGDTDGPQGIQFDWSSK